MPLRPDATGAGPSALRQKLLDIANQLGLAPSDSEIGSLLAYLALLQSWNATYNLTAIRDLSQMLTQHLADCLAVIGPLQRHLGKAVSPRLLDVGSGGGLPGVVIAILNPGIQVTCVDTVGKKAAFVRQVAGELGLKNLAAEHARVEALKLPSFDVVASRAFASLSDFVTLTTPLLATDGAWMAMKGKEPAEEMSALPRDVAVFHVEHLNVPDLAAERCIVWIRRRIDPDPVSL